LDRKSEDFSGNEPWIQEQKVATVSRKNQPVEILPDANLLLVLFIIKLDPQRFQKLQILIVDLEFGAGARAKSGY
jgi:hypothetical protein